MQVLQYLLFSLPAFILVLGLVVFVHEFGHFQVGRWLGVKAKSFSIGWGPEWFGRTDKHGTRWKVSKIPIGGFVSWVDDTDPTSTGPASEEHRALSHDEARRQGHYRAMPVATRAAVAAAGPFANFLFAIVVFAVVALIMGRADFTDYAKARPYIAAVDAGSPAEAAGIKADELVTAVNGVPIVNMPEFQNIVARSAGKPLEITLVSGDGARVVEAIPGQAIGSNRGLLGVRLTFDPAAVSVLESPNPIEAIGYGAWRTWSIIRDTLGYIGGIFSGREDGSGIAGPFGIFNQTGEVTKTAVSAGQAAGGVPAAIGMLVIGLIGWSALLSVAIGFANLLPIPLLDGGHLVLYAAEAIRGGKPLPDIVQEWMARVGVGLILGIFLFATWNDITRSLTGAPG